MGGVGDAPAGDEAEPVDDAPLEWIYATPTGEPCPRTVRVDGTVEGTGHCVGCGCCLLGTGLV